MDRQTRVSEFQGERPVGPRFDRSKILRLLSEDRTTIGRKGEREGIRVYLEGYVGYLRGEFYSCLEERGHPLSPMCSEDYRRKSFWKRLMTREPT